MVLSAGARWRVNRGASMPVPGEGQGRGRGTLRLALAFAWGEEVRGKHGREMRLETGQIARIEGLAGNISRHALARGFVQKVSCLAWP